MTRRLTAISALCLLASAALPLQAQTTEAKTRADVKAEAAAAEKDGSLPKGDAAAKTTPMPKSTKPRADVKSEAAAAAKNRTLPVGQGMDVPASGPRSGTVKPRAAVKAEAASAERSGTIITGEGIKR